MYWLSRTTMRFQEAVTRMMQEKINEFDPIERFRAWLKWAPLVAGPELKESEWLTKRLESECSFGGSKTGDIEAFAELRKRGLVA